MLTAAPPIDAPTAEAVMARAATENFSVASRVLPRRSRAHLLAVYGFARLVDELGDAAGPSPAERLAALDWLQAELERAFTGEAEHPLLVRLGVTVRECRLTRDPFVRLIEANRLDQRVSRYRTWAQLREYCSLSADPVGELVLAIFGLSSPARIELSNSICTALQLAEHCQDVGEDFARGRVYLPQEDLARFAATEADLEKEHASRELQAVLAFEVSRARELLVAGTPLIAQLHGRPKLAVAAFVAGGNAALDAIVRARYEVLAGPPRAGRARRALALAAALRDGRTLAPRRARS
jgi:squalene synthase HpnC